MKLSIMNLPGMVDKDALVRGGERRYARYRVAIPLRQSVAAIRLTMRHHLVTFLAAFSAHLETKLV